MPLHGPDAACEEREAMQRRVIGYKYLPSRPPWITTAVMWLYWDRYRPPQWVTTLGCVFLAIFWIGAIAGLCIEETLAPPDVKEDR